MRIFLKCQTLPQKSTLKRDGHKSLAHIQLKGGDQFGQGHGGIQDGDKAPLAIQQIEKGGVVNPPLFIFGQLGIGRLAGNIGLKGFNRRRHLPLTARQADQTGIQRPQIIGQMIGGVRGGINAEKNWRNAGGLPLIQSVQQLLHGAEGGWTNIGAGGVTQEHQHKTPLKIAGAAGLIALINQIKAGLPAVDGGCIGR